MRGRIALACVLTFVLGYVLARPTLDLIRSLLISFTRSCDDQWEPCLIPYDGKARTWLIIGLVLLIGLVIWVCRICARRALRPIHGMAGTVRELGPQNLGQRIRRGGANDELRELADSVDEMLDRVVVGAEAKTVHSIPDRRCRGEHQDPRLTVTCDDPPADLVTVHFWQVSVEHNDVVPMHGDSLHRGIPVVTDIHGHVHVPQAFGDGIREHLLVLGHQNAHASHPSQCRQYVLSPG